MKRRCGPLPGWQAKEMKKKKSKYTINTLDGKEFFNHRYEKRKKPKRKRKHIVKD